MTLREQIEEVLADGDRHTSDDILRAVRPSMKEVEATLFELKAEGYCGSFPLKGSGFIWVKR